MILIIKKHDAEKKIASLLENKIKNVSKGNLSKHFGSLKRNIDGLDYQLEVRKNEN